MFANCDPRVVTIDDLAGLVRIPPQKMRETTREQLRRVRENDELRNLQRKLRDENDELRARLEAAQVALLGFDGIADMPLPALGL